MPSQDLIIKLRKQTKTVINLIDALEKSYTPEQGGRTKSDHGLLGERLTQARRSKGLKVKKVAELAGVHINTIYSAERGIRDLSCFNLAVLADIYNVSTDWLLGRDIKN